MNGRVLRDEGFVDGLAVLLDGPTIQPSCRRTTPAFARSTLRRPGRPPADAGVHRHPGERRRRRAVQRRTDRRIDRAIGRAHRPFGTTGFLPTLISDDLHVIEARASIAVRDAIAQRVPGVLGIHIEGPVPQSRAHAASTTPRKLRALDAECGQTTDDTDRRRHDGHARAGDDDARVDPRAGRGGRHRLRGTHAMRRMTSCAGARRRFARLHAPVQRDVAARQSRAGRGRRRSRRRGELVRTHRRRRARAAR